MRENSTVASVCFFPINEVAMQPDKYLPYCTKKRKKRAYAIKNSSERYAIIAAGYLLYHYLNVRSDDDLYSTPDGKLYLNTKSRYFNLSYGGEYVALAISDREIGVDIEPNTIRESLYFIPHRAFTPDESAWLETHPDNESFAQIWTRKEAVLKAAGKGFHLNPENYSTIKQAEFYIESFLFNDHCISVAMQVPFSIRYELLKAR